MPESPSPNAAAPQAARFRAGPWLLGATLLLGAALRLCWSGTMEYKEDEAWLCRLVSDHCIHGEWTALGMPSSQHVRVPGLSVWAYYPFGQLFGVEEPIGLARGVQWCSIAALVGLVVLAWRSVPAAEREPWLWAAALIAVNPTAVIFQRKPWPPCILPIFCVAFFAGWWRRDRRWGAMVWGAVGALLGQIHATGFFFALAIVLMTVAAVRRGVRWGWWLAGSILGTLPMTPWLLYLIRDRDPIGSNALELHRWIEGKFWGHWITEPIGLDLRGIFGADHADYLRWPLVNGCPTYGAAIAQLLTALLGAVVLAVGVHRWWQRRLNPSPPTQSALLVRAGFICFGLMLTLAAVRLYRHYLIVTFPLMALWLARLALPDGGTDRQRLIGRRLLTWVCAVNALNCVLMLTYLHANGGAPHGPYGKSYEAQVQESGLRPPVIPLPIDAGPALD